MSPNYNFAKFSTYYSFTTLPLQSGDLTDCGSVACVGEGFTTNPVRGNVTKMAVPESDAGGAATTLTLFLSGLAILLGKSRYPRRRQVLYRQLPLPERFEADLDLSQSEAFAQI